MNNVNKVIITGNLTRKPELRYTRKGRAVAEIPIASHRNFKNKEGEILEETTYVDVSAFGRLAEVMAEYLEKGKCVFVDGRLYLSRWTNDDGSKRSKLKIIADKIQFLSKKAVVEPN